MDLQYAFCVRCKLSWLYLTTNEWVSYGSLIRISCSNSPSYHTVSKKKCHVLRCHRESSFLRSFTAFTRYYATPVQDSMVKCVWRCHMPVVHCVSPYISLIWIRYPQTQASTTDSEQIYIQWDPIAPDPVYIHEGKGTNGCGLQLWLSCWRVVYESARCWLCSIGCHFSFPSVFYTLCSAPLVFTFVTVRNWKSAAMRI